MAGSAVGGKTNVSILKADYREHGMLFMLDRSRASGWAEQAMCHRPAGTSFQAWGAVGARGPYRGAEIVALIVVPPKQLLPHGVPLHVRPRWRPAAADLH
jgi:hypothetical protein